MDLREQVDPRESQCFNTTATIKDVLHDTGTGIRSDPDNDCEVLLSIAFRNFVDVDQIELVGLSGTSGTLIRGYETPNAGLDGSLDHQRPIFSSKKNKISLGKPRGKTRYLALYITRDSEPVRFRYLRLLGTPHHTEYMKNLRAGYTRERTDAGHTSYRLLEDL